MYKILINKILIFFFLNLISFSLSAQTEFKWDKTFTKADSLRGKLSPFRSCYDVTYYDLNLKIDIGKQAISGYNDIYFEAKTDFSTLQIDLFEAMNVKKMVFNGDIEVAYKRIESTNAIFVTLPETRKGTKGILRIYYDGKPRKAINAPWDGGFSWKKDSKKNDWVGVSCEGIGASLWWPCKDHLSDEPDSMRINVSVPKAYMCVSNGNLKSQKPDNEGYMTYDWRISYPINSYNVTLNIANYAHFSDIHTYKDGTKLTCDYYVLPENLARAKKHFVQVHTMLDAYDHYFGKYPFLRDGYCLVETPYLGMEHQGAIAYGNKYMRGYLGERIPSDMNWDYIIVHESGHEYWGNSISCDDHADMWIHESFTTYMEALFVEQTMSYKDAVRYLLMQRNDIEGHDPMVGPRDVNFDDWQGSDIYYKGAWMLHTLRSTIDDDKVFFGLLRSYYDLHKISVVNTQSFIDYVNTYTKKDYTYFFNQYLYQAGVPKLEYKLTPCGKNFELNYRWANTNEDFRMPLKIKIGQYGKKIFPTKSWQTKPMKVKEGQALDFGLDRFLIDVQAMDVKD